MEAASMFMWRSLSSQVTSIFGHVDCAVSTLYFRLYSERNPQLNLINRKEGHLHYRVHYRLHSLRSRNVA
jgi:hypothetical protein